ncbi:MAG: class I SAM-dependent methyltransferase family protein [Candidatus Aenigmatarchaeota archaeon]
MNLKDVLNGRLEKSELAMVSKSFDIIGDVAVMELDDSLKKKQKIIAEAVMKVHKHVKTVCVKSGERGGKLRLRKLKKIAGNGFETIHTEFGCRYKLDVRKAFFSPRECTERKRIADQVKPGEEVLVMFSGIGPYGIMIARTQRAVGNVHCIELNKDACSYSTENAMLNKTTRVETICGDVGKEWKRFRGSCSRVVMPAPTEAYKYLDEAVACCRTGGVLHFYFIGHHDDLFSEAESLLKEACEEVGRKYRILSRKKVLPYAPRAWKICLDAVVG